MVTANSMTYTTIKTPRMRLHQSKTLNAPSSHETKIKFENFQKEKETKMRAENVENFVLEKSVSIVTPKRDPPRKAACPADG